VNSHSVKGRAGHAAGAGWEADIHDIPMWLSFKGVMPDMDEPLA